MWIFLTMAMMSLEVSIMVRCSLNVRVLNRIDQVKVVYHAYLKLCKHISGQ